MRWSWSKQEQQSNTSTALLAPLVIAMCTKVPMLPTWHYHPYHSFAAEQRAVVTDYHSVALI
jgi:NADH:ubiquinone oxidoreductase subunit 4 (subunit M)